MHTTALPRPPRIDLRQLVLMGLMLAAGLAFFAVCRDAHASTLGTVATAQWVNSNLAIGNASSTSATLTAGSAGSAGSSGGGAGGSVTLAGGPSFDTAGSSIFIAGTTPERPGDVRIKYGSSTRVRFDEDGSHLFGDVVDVNGDPVVTLGMLFNTIKSLYLHDEQFVTRDTFAEHERERSFCMVGASVAGGFGGATLATILGMTLFSRAFSMRRWVSRASRSLERKKQEQAASVHF